MKAWSWSALESFETCPKRHWHTRIKKDFVEGPSEALSYGDMVHKALEKRVINGKKLPLELQQLEKWVKPIADAPGKKFGEQKLALNIACEPAGWFDDDVWVRAILDFAIVAEPVATIIDWKTGRKKDDVGQLALCAAVTFSFFPEVETIVAGYGWTRNKQFTKEQYTREDIPYIWAELLPRVEAFQRAFSDSEFPARPSGLCRKYCPVKSCVHHGT